MLWLGICLGVWPFVRVYLIDLFDRYIFIVQVDMGGMFWGCTDRVETPGKSKIVQNRQRMPLCFYSLFTENSPFGGEWVRLVVMTIIHCCRIPSGLFHVPFQVFFLGVELHKNSHSTQ